MRCFFVPFGFGAVLAVGCGYDWALRAYDAAAPADSSVADVATDAAALDANVTEGGPSCGELAAKQSIALDRARSCTLASGHCLAKETDGCGCGHFVAVAGGPAANEFRAAAAAFRDAGCLASCDPTPCPALPAAGVCLSQATPDGGVSTRCSP